MPPLIAPPARSAPALPPGRRRPSRAVVAAALAVGVGLGLGGCAQAEQAARSAVEEAAREAVMEATGPAGEAARESAREQARRAVDDALDQARGTCSQLLAVPRATREAEADNLLRAFWLTELTTDAPPAETVEAFHDAVVERCEDSRETQAADVVREVWESGEFAP
jgi:hypothetical protein